MPQSRKQTIGACNTYTHPSLSQIKKKNQKGVMVQEFVWLEGSF